MESLKVALLQLLPKPTTVGNLQKGLAACRAAKEQGADIALFPEMWSVGYCIPADPAALKAAASPVDGDFVQSFGQLARELDMAIGITLLEQYQPLPRNTLCLFDRFGQLVLHYAKVHTCDFGDECRLTPGDDFYVCDLDTAQGVVRVGGMVCYDRELPESARILMLKGAELLLVPNACPMEINRLAQLRARAYENMVAIATVNYPAGKPDCNGQSTVFDGIAYLPDGDGSRDMLVLQTNEREGIYLAKIPLEQLRSYRATEVHGNAYRHPQKYHLLVSEQVDPPFVRDDCRR